MTAGASDPADGRTRTIKVRVTDDERDRLKDLCARKELARWMREYCLGAEPEPDDRPYVKPPPVDPAMLRQLAGIGNNLNQVARAVNKDGDSLNQVQITGLLVAIERELVAIKRAHTPASESKGEGG